MMYFVRKDYFIFTLAKGAQRPIYSCLKLKSETRTFRLLSSLLTARVMGHSWSEAML